jgi:hypothetical protein
MKCSALALVTLCVFTTSASAAPRKARFRATIEGVQTITWSVDTTGTNPACGETYRGSGRERIRFRSPKPQRLTVRMSHGVPIYAMGRRWAELLTNGSVTRHGSLTAIPHPNGVPCGGGAPGGDPPRPPASDCGTEAFEQLPLMPVPLGRNAIRFEVGDPAPLPPFQTCPVYGPAFPTLLGDVKTRLPARELFDRSIGKEIVLGGGHRRESAAGITTDTRLKWTLTLERRGR